MKICLNIGTTHIQSDAAQHLISNSSKGLIISHLLLPFYCTLYEMMGQTL